jgi:hypothetical protein
MSDFTPGISNELSDQFWQEATTCPDCDHSINDAGWCDECEEYQEQPSEVYNRLIEERLNPSGPFDTIRERNEYYRD